MLDEKKLKLAKKIGLAFAILLALLIGYGSGKSSLKPKQSKKIVATHKVSDKLRQKQVEDFLVAYYTKKDLGTNRNRYKPFMTDSMYQQELSKENDSVNKAYKGYVVDFKLKESDIYINQKTATALVTVHYTNTLLAKKNNYDKAQKNVSNEATMRLTYVDNGKGVLKLNQIQSALLTVSGEEETTYPEYGNTHKMQAGSSEAQSESSQSTREGD
ncbi:hypothetical protein [Streptococcus agalactiae]|uniref:hypothetical protein n=1 Tax=Streptococcus agalactiae TaxID=1311 RepID=UPI00130349E0|nr:hypothetical protein [Streptococcus agalactiae]KAF0052057.1 hypothetical protein GL192_00825 [Streptococcus agalactiae]